MRMRFLFLVGLMFTSPQLLAQDMPLGCIGQAAREYGLPPKLLHSLYLTERGKLGKRVFNTSNGTYDLGPFQINTRWLGVLAPYGIDANLLTNNPMVNARAAAWRLRSEIILAKNNVWRGVGNYRSRTPKFHQEQVTRVVAHYNRLPDNINYESSCYGSTV